MIRSLSALVFVALFACGADAGPTSVVKRNRLQAAGSKYLVSADLNKLVFWCVPSRDEAQAPRR